MPDAPHALALTAGILAAVNPCGFALLPAYLSLLVVGNPADVADNSRLTAVVRALILTAAMAVGFVAVFGAFGLLAAPVADAAARNLPWLSILIGLCLAAVGGWLLIGRGLPALRTGRARGPAVSRRFGSMVAFGASYAIASLGCTVGPFLAVVVSAFRPGSSPVAGVGLFVTYATGMVVVVGTVAIAVALADRSVVRTLRRAGSIINRFGGALLVVAGLYVAWYGWYELRVFADATTTDPIIDAALRLQTAMADTLTDLGPTTVVLIFAAVLASATAVAVFAGRRRSDADRQQSEQAGEGRS